MLQEGTHSKKWKTHSEARPSVTLATPTPPPPVNMEVPHVAMPPPPEAKTNAPPPALVAPQGNPPVPTFVPETLQGLEELSGYIIGHLKKMTDRLNSIELRVERLEHIVAPQLPHHLSVPLDL